MYKPLHLAQIRPSHVINKISLIEHLVEELT